MPNRRDKYRGNRIEIRVSARRENGGFVIHCYDNRGLLSKTGCYHKSNVTMTATRAASLALDVPEGRIKISRLEYA
ncbi:hypothetical protein SEA_DAKITI_5 [Gordonia phage Dakiti]|uniref:Uncharacterized protein n=1 Tax=Gordonia phage Chelms TaxID=2588132 RepID=A0A4Y6EHK6_9CAUD|nr:hypothetical protein HWC24_gp005 [Gordonia phage Chelms]QDF18220.1 hypothetical protein SEA_CHELMS_5 [Gordonia phage Chelms]QOR56151.1 hypothetical protein SEA_LINETTI_6 [Gordonia phage Linetti]WIC39993.1 hypothetical protein SEA_DAKITI_5 [Gordonia phage Dakiti]